MTAIETREVVVEKDVVFGRGGARELLCDVHRPPPERTKETAIIHMHGGAFRAGSRAGARVAQPLAALGYLGVAMQYRLLDEASWPAQIHDVKTCIRWVRANAVTLGVDPAKVVVLGHSAGGRLALIAAGTQNLAALEGDGGNAGVGTEVAACVGFYPAAATSGAGHPVLGPNASEELVRSFSPLSYVRQGYPPTILFHGTADTMVPVDASFQLNRALSEAGVSVELHAIEGVTHIFDAHQDLAELCSQWVDLFLDRHVVNPRRYPSTEPPQP